MRVLLIRHAECEDNVVEADPTRRMTSDEFASFIRGAADSPLTQGGRVAAARLVARLGTEELTGLYTSPLPRALDTAGILAAGLGLREPVVVPGLRELVPHVSARAGSGRETGVSVRRQLQVAYLRMLLAPQSPDRLTVSVPRIVAAWRTVTSAGHEHVGVVGHGWVTWILVSLLRLDPRWRVGSTDYGNCGITIVERRGGGRGILRNRI